MVTDLFHRTIDPLLAFEIEGDVRGKGRPRIGRTKSGHPIAFTDAKTRRYESYVALAVNDAMRQTDLSFPIDKPLAVEIVFRLQRPRKPRWPVPAVRPDLDNLVKAICDGAQQAKLWRDDARIVELHVRKEYGPPLGASVRVYAA